MQNLFEYMLKLSLCYGIIYIFYFLLLRRFTHYTGNRFFLLVSSVLAFMIPLLRVDLFLAQQTINTSSLINSMPSVNLSGGNIFIPTESSWNIPYFLFVLFVIGVMICLSNFIIQLYSFKRIKDKARLIEQNETMKLYHLNMDIIPFSFGNAVYLNKEQHSKEELEEIIKHESVHVYQMHTIDIIIAEIICILNWYNPFAWLIKHAIKQNLEFLADDAVIQNGTDKKDYQYLLLKVMGNSPIAIASNLNFSPLKQRIYMMNKKRTSRKHLLKFLFVLPVIAVLMLAFRDTNSNDNTSMHISTKEETYNLGQLTYSIPDANIATIVRKDETKSLLQVGKPFTVALIKDERDRLRSLLEKNGYTNINDHSISFLIDSSLSNNSFSVQVNIDLQIRSTAVNKNNQANNKTITTINNSKPGNINDNLLAKSSVNKDGISNK